MQEDQEETEEEMMMMARMTSQITDQTWTDKTYNASDYINNDRTTVVDDQEFREQTALSEVIKPQADNS